MNKILVPTDFSPNSLKSLEYVIESTKHVAVEIILIWVNSIRSKDILVPELEGMSTERAAAAQLEKIIEDYTPKLKNGSRITQRIRHGKVHLEVADQAKCDDVDLVVCCTHGASGFEETYIGSNAFRIVMYCKYPVITVRPNYRFQAPSGIYILPIDSSMSTRQKASFTCRLAKLTNSEIHVLGLYSTKMSSIRNKVNNYVAQIERYLSTEKIKYTINYREVDNVTKATVAYAESVNADLISIMTEQESTAWSFLLGTYAQQMLNAASMPVLSITPKQLLKTSLK